MALIDMKILEMEASDIQDVFNKTKPNVTELRGCIEYAQLNMYNEKTEENFIQRLEIVLLVYELIQKEDIEDNDRKELERSEMVVRVYAFNKARENKWHTLLKENSFDINIVLNWFDCTVINYNKKIIQLLDTYEVNEDLPSFFSKVSENNLKVIQLLRRIKATIGVLRRLPEEIQEQYALSKWTDISDNLV